MTQPPPDHDNPDPSAVTGTTGGRHPVNGLNEIVHQRSRLGVLTILREADRVEFGYLRDALEVTDGNLSRHLRTLEDAGYIEVHKGYHGRRPRTWLILTKAGRAALDQELSALRALVSRLDPPAPQPKS
ncbi:MAG: transcriptional regulator [Actinomycetota bacterium]|nr:transcriptional regulator [Actinomycetota bacterium]